VTPGPDLSVPDLPPGMWKLAALAAVFFAGRLVWQTGLLDPSRLRSPLPKARLRRKAYRVVCEAGLAKLVGGDDRTARSAHERRTIRDLKRDGRWAVYVLIRHAQGLDLSEGARKRAEFEARWRHAMTRPDDDGNPAHEWIFQPYTGTSTIAVRWAPLPHPEATRLFELLQPLLKWKEGTRAADVIDARTDATAG
jgi:hypothetical protein